MNSPPPRSALRRFRLHPGCLLLLALAGTYGATTPALAAPAVSIVIAPADYVYYPDSEVYYHSSSHRYFYRNGDRWYTGRQPPRRWNRHSPAVHLDFRDAPQRHHAETSRSYPKHWRPKAADRNDRHDQDRRDDNRHDQDRKDDNRRDRR